MVVHAMHPHTTTTANAERTGEELGEDAAEGPHVDLGAVRHAQNHLGRAVASGLFI